MIAKKILRWSYQCFHKVRDDIVVAIGDVSDHLGSDAEEFEDKH